MYAPVKAKKGEMERGAGRGGSERAMCQLEISALFSYQDLHPMTSLMFNYFLIVQYFLTSTITTTLGVRTPTFKSKSITFRFHHFPICFILFWQR
jgi:hypothetical protein